VIFLLGLGGLVASRLTALAASQEAAPRVGYRAPDFTLPTLDGRPVNLRALEGRVVLINFWASWCPPCREEMPALQSVYAQHKPEHGLEILAVNQMEDPVIVVTFAELLGLTFPIPLDSDGAVSQRYQVRGIPTTFLVDRGGVIRDIVIGGPMSEAYIESKLAPLWR